MSRKQKLTSIRDVLAAAGLGVTAAAQNSMVSILEKAGFTSAQDMADRLPDLLKLRNFGMLKVGQIEQALMSSGYKVTPQEPVTYNRTLTLQRITYLRWQLQKLEAHARENGWMNKRGKFV